MDVLQIKNLSFCYPPQEDGEKVKALADIHLSVKEGDFIIICGASGSGKSTLLKLIKPQLAPKGELTGQIDFYGHPLAEHNASEIGFVAQNPESQIVTDKVWHELAFGLENMGVGREKMLRLVAEMASCFGLERQYLSETAVLSGGEKQLLNLAGVLVMGPKLLLLDEPTSQLDPVSASRFLYILKKLNEEWGCTIILAEHRLEECIPLADTVVVLKKGHIIACGRPEEMYDVVKTENLGECFPAAMQLASALGEKNLPITVKEGRNWLREKHGKVLAQVDIKPQKAMGEVLISCSDIWFAYERNAPYIVKGADIKLRAGEILGILGGNGSGKSTLLSLLGGVRRSVRGKVSCSVSRGLLPQNPESIFLADTVGEDYDSLLNEICDSAEAENRKKNVVERLGLSAFLNRNPYDLSGGEQQLCALGKVLLTQPKILLLDEPTKAMDVENKKLVMRLLKELAAEGCGIILVTHDVCIAAELSSACGIFFDGQLTEPQEVHSFFMDNNYYIPPASRLARGMSNAISVPELIRSIGADI